MGLFSSKSSHCGACGHEASKQRPLTTVKVGDHKGRVHKDHTTDPKSGLFAGRKH
jgi:hypothetical protein